MACANETHLKHPFARELDGGQPIELERDGRDNYDYADDDDDERRWRWKKGININKLMEC